MEKNILSQGISELYTIKDILLELNQQIEKKDTLELEENRLEKTIGTKEKAIQNEIVNTTKKRKDEIESTYDNQANKTKGKIKKIKGKKEKSKAKKVSQRIIDDTGELRSEYKEIEQKANTILKENKIPRFCNQNLFFTLYMPKGFGDFVKIILILGVLLFVIPFSIYFFLLPEEKIQYLFIIYAIIVVIPGSIYMLIENNIKDKHIQKLKEIQQLRRQLSDNKKGQDKIKKHIKRDKDESVYELDNYNNELVELESELNSVSEGKLAALALFESTTRHEISNEIKARYEQEMQTLKEDYDKVYQEHKSTEDRIKNLSLDIANTYEVYMGKEFITIEKLELLINFMKDNNINTISEGITLYKKDN